MATCHFQTTLFREINKLNINKNVIISPLSAYQLLGLIANQAEGNTLDEIISVLDNVNIEEINTVNGEIVVAEKSFSSIEIANAVMTANDPKKSFSLIAGLYEAKAEKLQSIKQVNNWCNSNTHGKIEKIIDSLDTKIIMLLLNAIYYKGIWETEFDVRNTKKGIFYNFNDKSIKANVELMSIESEFLYYEDNTVQIIELPYEKDSMSSYIILPNENMNINDYISNLSDDKLPKIIKNMNSRTVNLALPKFEIDFSTNLASALKNMGMKISFTSKAQFNKIVDNSKNFYLNDIIQKIIFSVDEKGANAATVKTETIRRKNVEKIPLMIVNRPFLFMLRNSEFPKNYQILFMSKIEEL